MAKNAKQNYYAVLGVQESATNDEIRTAYKNLARKYHPDKNPGDKACEERFKLINEAYNTLGDAAKRGTYDYDLRNSDANNNPRRSSTNTFGTYSNSDFSDFGTSTGRKAESGSNRYSSKNNMHEKFSKHDFKDWTQFFEQFAKGANKETTFGRRYSYTTKDAKKQSKRKTSADFGSFFKTSFGPSMFSQPSFAFSDFEDFTDSFETDFERFFFKGAFPEHPFHESEEGEDSSGIGRSASGKNRSEQDAFVRCKFCRARMNVVELCEHEPKCLHNPSNIKEKAEHGESTRRASGVFGETDDDMMGFGPQRFHRRYTQPDFGYSADGFEDYFFNNENDWRQEHEATINKIRRDRERAAGSSGNVDGKSSSSNARTATDGLHRTKSGTFSSRRTEASNRSNGTESEASTSRSRPSTSNVFNGARAGAAYSDFGGGCEQCRALYGDQARFHCSCGYKTAR